MASYPQIKIRHSPLTTYPGTAPTSFVGAQTTPGNRGALPTFTDANAYWFSSTGSDSGFGISGSPWRNLSKIFGFSTTWADSSGNGYTLTPAGSSNILTYPCAPKPPKGTSAVAQSIGGMTGSAGLVNALKGKTQYTFETWLFVADSDLPGSTGTIFQIAGSGTTTLQVLNNGGLRFTSNGGGTVQTTIGNGINSNQWFYVALVVNANVTNGTQIWIGSSPETARIAAAGTVTVGIQAGATSFTLGPQAMSLGRTAISTAVRTSFPTLAGASNLTALWRFSTPCLMESSPRSYVVFADSGTWNEQIYCPWVYDMANAFDVYAIDGAAPVIELGRGTSPNSYGPNYLNYAASGTPNYYINQTTGNDATGARNDPTKPFKTIQVALNNGSVTNGDIFEIQDGLLYKESLSFPAGKQNLQLRALAGQNPILAPATSGGIQATLPSTSGTYTFKNLTFEGYAPSSGCSLFYGSTGLVSVAMDGCAVRNFWSLANQAWGSINVSLASTNNAFSNTTNLSAGGSYVNCYFHNQAPLGQYVLAYAPLTTASFKLCSFDNTRLDFGAYYEINLFDQCLFTNCIIQTSIDGRISKSNALTNCTLDKSMVQICGQCLIENCQQFSDSLNLASGFSAPSSAASSGILQIENCSAIRNQINFNFDSKENLSFSHLTSVAGSTGGYSWTMGPALPVAYAPFALVSAGDTAAIVGTPVIAFPVESNALITSTTLGAENITLQAQDGGIFNAGDGLTDAGVDYLSWDLPKNSTVNGLIFKGPINGEAALGSSYGATIKAAFCTFSGLGTYAVRGSNLGGAGSCYFQTNGHAVKNNGANTYVTGSIGNACGGAFILNIGQGLIADHDTAFLCQYGIYEVPSSTAGKITNTILNGSALYDYSGPNILSYCCAPNLDPAQEGSLDGNSLSVDPLFFAPLSSDLRLQSPAIGNYYTSPCIGADNVGGNMGALAYTYGPATTSWTLLDFGAQDIYGNFYRNPDKVTRKELPIKLAEGDRENGAIFSVAATFKREYEMAWEQNTNDMPQAQVVDMLNMFTSFTNELQIDFGLGLGWQPGYFARQDGFEWTDMTGFYSDASQPTPVRTLVIREA